MIWIGREKERRRKEVSFFPRFSSPRLPSLDASFLKKSKKRKTHPVHRGQPRERLRQLPEAIHRVDVGRADALVPGGEIGGGREERE